MAKKINETELTPETAPETVEAETVPAYTGPNPDVLPKVLPYQYQEFVLKTVDGKVGYYAANGDCAMSADSEDELLPKYKAFLKSTHQI
jgi:hypothetical protein